MSRFRVILTGILAGAAFGFSFNSAFAQTIFTYDSGVGTSSTSCGTGSSVCQWYFDPNSAQLFSSDQTLSISYITLYGLYTDVNTRYVYLRFADIHNSYCSGTSTTPLTTTPQNITFALSSGCQVFFSSGDSAQLSVVTTSDFTPSAHVIGSSNTVIISGSPQPGFSGNFVAGSTVDWTAITTSPPFTLGTTSTAIAASSSLWSSISIASSSLSCSTGNVFSDALCSAGAYLFIPSPAVLNNFSLLPQQLGTRFPFSWIYGVQSAINGLTASSTTNFEPAILNLHDLGVGSTTPIGNILPNFDALSTSTIQKYMPVGTWDDIQLLISASLWLGLGLYLFYETRSLLHRV